MFTWRNELTQNSSLHKAAKYFGSTSWLKNVDVANSLRTMRATLNTFQLSKLENRTVVGETFLKKKNC